jgi:hypothetical protein
VVVVSHPGLLLVESHVMTLARPTRSDQGLRAVPLGTFAVASPAGPQACAL